MQKSLFLVLGLLIGGAVMWFFAGSGSTPDVDPAASKTGPGIPTPRLRS
jgi:hypothetical protein